jgi:hypothetical protein
VLESVECGGGFEYCSKRSAVLSSQGRDVCVLRSVFRGKLNVSWGKSLFSKNRYVMIEPLLSNTEGQISASTHDGCQVSSSERSRYVMETTWEERSRFCSSHDAYLSTNLYSAHFFAMMFFHRSECQPVVVSSSLECRKPSDSTERALTRYLSQPTLEEALSREHPCLEMKIKTCSLQ